MARPGVTIGRLVIPGLLALATQWFAQDAWQAVQSPTMTPSTAVQCFTAATTAGLTGWLLCIHLAYAIARIPGATGAIARTLVERTTPATMRRLAALTLATTAWAPQAQAATAISSPGITTAVSSQETLQGPNGDRPLPDPGLHPDDRARKQAARAKTVTVRPGDTLWQITARHLGDQATPAEIAVEWPRWLAANRTELPNPHRLRPGQTLTSPLSPKAPR
ncbi:LysM peptidoglycan-binding domain-containing protein [Austwickia chelonae]|uniref:LysM peptidoglycan-binding domain-containing protein n=1 Tax=Austwickia chelonae TaxID=100225 RepID=UPI000E251E5F|nr:LysM peptidoglycan-binding domain-containing protein [Austwickia chelonae]